MGACWKKMSTKCTSINKIIKEIQDVVNVVTDVVDCKGDDAKPPDPLPNPLPFDQHTTVNPRKDSK